MTGLREGRRGVSRTAISMVVVGGIGILGQIKVTPKWEDDHVRRHVGGGGDRAGGGGPPWKEIRQREEREGRVK